MARTYNVLIDREISVNACTRKKYPYCFSFAWVFILSHDYLCWLRIFSVHLSWAPGRPMVLGGAIGPHGFNLRRKPQQETMNNIKRIYHK